MTLKHDWTQHSAHKKWGCMYVPRDFKSLEVFHLDAGSIKSLFGKFFFSLLLSIPRRSLVFHFSVGILFILTLIWFKVDINQRKSFKKNHIPFIYAPKISRMQLNKMFPFGPKWFLVFFSPAALLPSFAFQVQRFLAVQHQTKPSIIDPALPECAAALGTAHFPLPACQSGWWAWPPEPSLPSQASWRLPLGPDLVWWGGTGGQRGETGPIFSTAKGKQSCC